MRRGRPRLKPEDRKQPQYINSRPFKEYEAEINGRRFKCVPYDNKTSCRECDIFKLKRLHNQSEKPLCYEYSVRNSPIVRICQGHRMIWVEI